MKGKKQKALFALCIAVVILIFATRGAEAQNGGFGSQTAQTLFQACKAEVSDDAFVKKAICINYANSAERDECLAEMAEERKEILDDCGEQRDWRLEACEVIGEDRYDPEIDPAAFESDYHNLNNPNPYFPLKIGNKWRYQGGGELNTLEVMNQTKSIEGVDCVVIRDKVFDEGALVENTDDWYCQNVDGNVWYFGEEVKDFETFEGDKPMRPELVSIDGSFKAGRDGDKPGIIFLSSPRKGDAYIEEFSLGNAEDVTIILSNSYAYGREPKLDHLVPQQLAQLLCSEGDCVVTKNFSLLEPGIVALKYYARGIGVFVEVELNTQHAIQLIDCNFDSRCQNLPTP